MTKKVFICTVIGIILSLCCGMSFAAEEGKDIKLGNEIVKSIDKTEHSFENVVSGNVIMDTTNSIKDTGNMINDHMNDMERKDENEIIAGSAGNYNTTRTTAEETINSGVNSGINTMTATTWMWIILIMAAVVIITAIWFYATQDNG